VAHPAVVLQVVEVGVVAHAAVALPAALLMLQLAAAAVVAEAWILRLATPWNAE